MLSRNGRPRPARRRPFPLTSSGASFPRLASRASDSRPSRADWPPSVPLRARRRTVRARPLKPFPHRGARTAVSCRQDASSPQRQLLPTGRLRAVSAAVDRYIWPRPRVGPQHKWNGLTRPFQELIRSPECAHGAQDTDNPGRKQVPQNARIVFFGGAGVTGGRQRHLRMCGAARAGTRPRLPPSPHHGILRIV